MQQGTQSHLYLFFSSGDDAAEQVLSGTMPQWYYVLLHSSAKLSATEKDELAKGLSDSMP